MLGVGDRGLIGLAAIGMLACFAGRPTHLVSHEPVANQAVSETFTAEVAPSDCSASGCAAFTLVIENRSTRPLEIDWARTQFVDDGQTRGGFMWEGIRYLDKDAPKAPDIILPKSRIEKRLYPTVLADFTPRIGWTNGSMGAGDKGIYITVVDGARVLATNMTYRFTAKPNTEETSPPTPSAAPASPAHLPAEVLTIRGGE